MTVHVYQTEVLVVKQVLYKYNTYKVKQIYVNEGKVVKAFGLFHKGPQSLLELTSIIQCGSS